MDAAARMSEPSVTTWYERLRGGDVAAAGPLWERYFARVAAAAARRMGPAASRVCDEEDIATLVLTGLCDPAAELPSLDGRDDLWRLLLTWTDRRVVDEARRQTARKRGGGHVRGDSAMPAQPACGRTLSPSEQLELRESLEARLASLGDATLQRVALAKLAGETNAEIAAALTVTERTVERKLAIIRSTWSG